MRGHKGPRPVAWEGWHAVVAGEPPRGDRAGMVDVQEFDGDELRCDYAMAPDEAERHALALIMAAAAARGEREHTAALSRVATVLDAARPMAEAYRQSLNAINRHLGEPVAELVTLPPYVADVVAERDRLRVELERERASHARTETSRGCAAREAARLRSELAEVLVGLESAERMEADR